MSTPEPVYEVTLNEKAKRDAVLSALKDAAEKGKLNIAALIHGMNEGRLAKCIQDDSLGTLTQREIDWLAVDLQK